MFYEDDKERKRINCLSGINAKITYLKEGISRIVILSQCEWNSLTKTTYL